jgi:hypothetical protein
MNKKAKDELERRDNAQAAEAKAKLEAHNREKMENEKK